MTFKNKALIIGYGAVCRCTLPILFKHIDIPYKNVTIIDFIDKRRELKPWTDRGVRYFQERITPINMAQLLSKYVSPGGLIIDLAWNIETIDMLNWCQDNKVVYINTSVEEWDPYVEIHRKTLFERSLYYRQLEIRKLASKWAKPKTTAVIDHGANPGLISHFMRKGLADITGKMMGDRNVPRRQKKVLDTLLRNEEFARLAMRLGVRVIHISERDTQVSDRPKQGNEFVGTWSIEGMREEGVAASEIGWGTHENELPEHAAFPSYGPKNQIFLPQMGMNTWVRSWVPYQEIIGMALRHAEAFTISDTLTVWEGKRAVYRPTVHYAYCPCDATIASLHELRGRNYELQPRLRIMSDEIIGGEDILGALIMGHKYNSWWTGSILSINTSRRLVPHQNATTSQVAIGVVSAVMWALKNPERGVCIPDNLPYGHILETARPYLGKFISEASDWTPFKNYQIFFRENPHLYLDKKNMWSFQNFLFKH